ncbi:MAG: hypothetical protein OEV20_08390 [Actinomycetota bacterium]|nr:hypothetical protein [Actinomycetota bacterium]
MSTILRSPLSAAVVAAVVLTVICFAVIEVAGADEEAPLQLGSEHLGMTSEGIAEAEYAADTERAVEEAIAKSEWTDEDLAEEAEFVEAKPVEAQPEHVCPVCEAALLETHAEGVSDYESCVEVAIRGGNAFTAASGVCQTLFPEPLEAAVEVDEAPVAPVVE